MPCSDAESGDRPAAGGDRPAEKHALHVRKLGESLTTQRVVFAAEFNCQPGAHFDSLTTFVLQKRLRDFAIPRRDFAITIKTC